MLSSPIVKWVLIAGVAVVAYHLIVTKTSLGAKVGIQASA